MNNTDVNTLKLWIATPIEVYNPCHFAFSHCGVSTLTKKTCQAYLASFCFETFSLSHQLTWEPSSRMGATFVITHRSFWHVRAGRTHQSCDCNLMNQCGMWNQVNGNVIINCCSPQPYIVWSIIKYLFKVSYFTCTIQDPSNLAHHPHPCRKRCLC